ncbi:hypothetical protein [Kribbella sp.]|uniref:hypothetical protein n=1 Tax=Kribbella sp. TaxID=1871183 RepID=UPI002D68336C|nr:hypothetical protein [Kribbella sp.]HZX07198.1 hypothetical protein [Kribbella sp.]
MAWETSTVILHHYRCDADGCREACASTTCPECAPWSIEDDHTRATGCGWYSLDVLNDRGVLIEVKRFCTEAHRWAYVRATHRRTRMVAA